MTGVQTCALPICTTLQNAASIASLILITEATVTDEPKDTSIEDAISRASAAGGQGGGMY